MGLKKGMEYLVRLTAQVDKALPGEMKKMANHLKGLESQMARYKKTGENFDLVKKKIKGTVEEYRKVRSQMRALEQAKARDGKLTKAQERQYTLLANRQEKLSKILDKQRESYKRYQYELERQKIPMKKLREEIEKTTRAYKKLEAEQKLTSAGQNLRSRVGSTAKGIGAKAVGVAKKAVVGATVAGVTAAGYVGMTSAQTYLDFNKNMKKVQAISGATAEEFKLLEKEAKRLGATTKFTAGEAAAAMEKMALAGFNTKDIIASMPGVLDLAAASGEDVAMVSDIITDNLTAFNMTAKDTGRFADVLSWGMSKTNVNVEMLGESFKYAAGSAGTLGVSLEEAVGSLGLMGDQAIKSGMAGRGLNEVFSRLVKNKDTLKKINIDIENSKGEFVGLVEVVKQFEKHTRNMKDIDKVAFLKNVFGEQGERSFSKLLSAQKTIDGITYTGAEALEKTVKSATKDSVGMAEKMKNIMLDSASGAMILLESAWDGIKIAIGDKIFSENNLKYIKIFTDYLSELANVLSGSFYDNKYNNFWKNFFTVAKSYMSKLYEALKPGINAIREMLPGKSEVTSRIKFIGDLILKIASVISWVILKIQALKKIIDRLGADNIIVFIAAFMGVLKVVAVITKLISAIKLLKEAGGIILGLKSIIMGFIGVNPFVLLVAGAIAAFATLAYVIYKNWDKIKVYILSAIEWIKGYIENFFALFGDLLPLAPLKAFWDAWDSGKPIMENLKNGIIAYIHTISEFLPIKIVKQFFEIWTSELGIVDKVKLSFTQTFDAIKQSILGTVDAVKNLGNKIKEIPVIKDILQALNIGTEPDGSHRNGLSYVPYDGYLAELHRGERVLTADENEQYGSLFNSLSPRTASTTNYSNSQSSISFSPNITINMSPNSNSNDLAEVLKEKINELEKEFIRKFRELERRKADEYRTKF